MKLQTSGVKMTDYCKHCQYWFDVAKEAQRQVELQSTEDSRLRGALTEIRDATHKSALMLRAIADRALSVSGKQS